MRPIKHGFTKHKLYKCWINIKQRCSNKNHTSYTYYGLKGIKVCPEWNNSFINFYEWAMNNGWLDNLTIDRKDSSKDYNPENCHWITKSENSRKAALSIELGKVHWKFWRKKILTNQYGIDFG